MNGVQAKEIARFAHAKHNENGSVFVDVDLRSEMSEEAGVFVNISEDWVIERVMGKIITQKDIKRFLWKMRGFKLPEVNTVLWTVYDEKKDMSFIGMGLQVSAEEAKMYEEAHPELKVVRC